MTSIITGLQLIFPNISLVISFWEFIQFCFLALGISCFYFNVNLNILKNVYESENTAVNRIKHGI